MKQSVPCVPRQSFHRVKDWGFALVLTLLASALYAQPVALKSIATASHLFTTVNGKLYYASADSLFTSDGTTSGTVLVKKTGETIRAISNIAIGNRMFFTTITGSNISLWVSEGTNASTMKVGTYPDIEIQIAYHSDLYLRIDDGVHGRELWKLDASNSLTMLKDIFPGSDDGAPQGSGWTVVSDDVLYFEGISSPGWANLWKTDGTSAGTVLAADMPFNDIFYSLTDVNGTIFFARDSLNEWDYTMDSYIWKTEGTTETTELVDAFYGNYPSSLYHFRVMNGKLYFFRDYDLPDQYLVVSDGTPEGTHDVKRVERDGQILDAEVLKNNLVFYSHSQGFPNAVVKSDGTTEGTVPFYQLNQHFSFCCSNDPIFLTTTDDYAFFVDHNVPSYEYPENGDGFQIFQSDLTVGGTKSFKALFGTSFEYSADIVSAGGNKIFFTTNVDQAGKKLWYYDADIQCAGAGGILRQVWNNVAGAQVSQIPTSTLPSFQEIKTSFAGPVNAGDRYGARYRGYLCVPESGNYRFWIASNDNSELWLSTDGFPKNKVKIAYVIGATNPGQYNKYPSQQSALISLQKGQLYYIEALHKEGVNSDHLSVGMQYPNGTLERPIQGARLIPFSDNIEPSVTLTSPTQGQELFAPADINLAATASDPDGNIASVSFYVSGVYWEEAEITTDNSAPYAYTWQDLPPGEYTFRAKATDNEGAETYSAPAMIKVIEGCTASGTILREVWNGIQGASVSYIPLNTAPQSTSYLNIFEGPSNIGDHYGTRIRGYLCPPTTGNYVFWIASNDNSELWISTDGNPANKVKIASVTGGTGIREWTKYASQRSAPISLTLNQRVYVEALHKEGVGNDNIAVGWTLPNGVQERPIPGNRLSPATGSAGRESTADIGLQDVEESETITLTPNPAKAGPVTLRIEGYENENTPSTVEVEIVNMVGQIVNTEPIVCKYACNQVTFEISDKLSPGIYVVKGAIDQKQFARRLMVDRR
jgi:ELWxxDGT repeat protein